MNEFNVSFPELPLLQSCWEAEANPFVPCPPFGAPQAASNMTLASDSRPVSPGPFSSALTSCTPADCSRPVSPHCVDSTPPTPGSFAPVGGAAAARAAAPLLSRSLPASPAPMAAAAAAVVAAASPPAGVGAAQPGAAFRLPIFNQEGRLVGYKQNRWATVIV
jgi:hypothetical protein